MISFERDLLTKRKEKMKNLRPFIAFTMALVIATSALNGHSPCLVDDEEFSPAYVESSHSAHWSVYIPIVALAGAAIWFGLADKSNSKKDSSDSQDALGSIANSKRACSSVSYKAYRAKTLPKGGYSH